MSQATTIDPRVPLALLRTVQERDAPGELLPDEDPGASFPHRLGLTGVVEDQIQEFQRLARKRRRVTAEQVQGLLELITRRPDAAPIFEAAGRELAELCIRGPTGLLVRLTRRLPSDALRRRTLARALRAAHGRILLAEDLEVGSSPVELRAVNALTADVGTMGVACRLYAGLLAGLAESVGLALARASHPECQARGYSACLWTLDRST